LISGFDAFLSPGNIASSDHDQKEIIAPSGSPRAQPALRSPIAPEA
jgi:hypothetical protein